MLGRLNLIISSSIYWIPLKCARQMKLNEISLANFSLQSYKFIGQNFWHWYLNILEFGMNTAVYFNTNILSHLFIQIWNLCFQHSKFSVSSYFPLSKHLYVTFVYAYHFNCYVYVWMSVCLRNHLVPMFIFLSLKVFLWQFKSVYCVYVYI